MISRGPFHLLPFCDSVIQLQNQVLCRELWCCIYCYLTLLFNINLISRYTLAIVLQGKLYDSNDAKRKISFLFDMKNTTRSPEFYSFCKQILPNSAEFHAFMNVCTDIDVWVWAWNLFSLRVNFFFQPFLILQIQFSSFCWGNCISTPLHSIWDCLTGDFMTSNINRSLISYIQVFFVVVPEKATVEEKQRKMGAYANNRILYFISYTYFLCCQHTHFTKISLFFRKDRWMVLVYLLHVQFQLLWCITGRGLSWMLQFIYWKSIILFVKLPVNSYWTYRIILPGI